MKKSTRKEPPQREVPRLAYSVREVAAMLNVSSKSVRRLVDRDLLKASRALRHLRITRVSLESFLAE
jgi:excisionase family DNA binding protein